MRIDLNSFVFNNCNDNNNINKKKKNFYNLKNKITNWNCKYNYELYQINKHGLMHLLDIEKRSMMAPDVDRFDW